MLCHPELQWAVCLHLCGVVLLPLPPPLPALHSCTFQKNLFWKTYLKGWWSIWVEVWVFTPTFSFLLLIRQTSPPNTLPWRMKALWINSKTWKIWVSWFWTCVYPCEIVCTPQQGCGVGRSFLDVSMWFNVRKNPISTFHPFKLVVSKHFRVCLSNTTNWTEISTKSNHIYFKKIQSPFIKIAQSVNWSMATGLYSWFKGIISWARLVVALIFNFYQSLFTLLLYFFHLFSKGTSHSSLACWGL